MQLTHRLMLIPAVLAVASLAFLAAVLPAGAQDSGEAATETHSITLAEGSVFSIELPAGPIDTPATIEARPRLALAAGQRARLVEVGLGASGIPRSVGKEYRPTAAAGATLDLDPIQWRIEAGGAYQLRASVRIDGKSDREAVIEGIPLQLRHPTASGKVIFLRPEAIQYQTWNYGTGRITYHLEAGGSVARTMTAHERLAGEHGRNEGPEGHHAQGYLRIP